MSQNDEMKTIEVFGKLITSDHSQFDTIAGPEIEKVPVSKDEMVIPTFSIRFTDFRQRPNNKLAEMVKEEINESVFDNPDVARDIRKIDPESVESEEPIGEPETKPVQIATIASTPSEDGIISDLYMENLRNAVDGLE